MDIFPQLGVSGIWTLLAPYENDLVPNAEYTCVAVRKISDIVAQGGDGYSDYYEKPHGLSFARYEEDLAKGVAIVSLQDSGGQVIYIPNTFIASYPSTDGVPYRRTSIALKLSHIPKGLDISLLLTAIIDASLDKIGVVATASVVATATTKLIDQDTHRALEAQRKARIASNSTDLAKYLAEKTRADAQAQRILELEAALKARM